MGFPGQPLWETAGDTPRTAFGDLDGDGHIEMVVAGGDVNGENGVVSVFTGAPEGFERRQDFDTGGSPASLSIADLDADGDLDVAIANQGSQSGMSIFLNVDGALTDSLKETGGCMYSISLALGDLNGDDVPDAAVACWLNGVIEVRMNDGHGKFGAVVSYTSQEQPWAPTSVAIGDVNADGHPDLVASDDRNGRVSVFINSGDGTFAKAENYKVSERPVDVALGDVNNDMLLDIALASAGGYGLDVLLNEGNGVFGAHTTYPILSDLLNPSSIALGDVNGDGLLDAALATDNGAGVVATFVNHGGGTFQLSSMTDLPTRAASTKLRDVNGDHIDDLLVGLWWATDLTDASIAVFPGLAGGDFSTPLVLPAAEDNCNAIVGGDFDGDGNFDMATACNNAQAILSIWYGAGGGTFARVDYPLGAIHLSLTAADLDGDGRTDIIDQSGGSTENDLAVMLARPDRTFSRTWYSVSERADASTMDAAVGDLDGDGDLDFVAANLGTSTIRVFFNAGNGTFPTHVDYPVELSARRLSIGDLDANGTLDVAFSMLPNGVGTFENDGHGVLTYRGRAPTGPDPTALQIADLDGDHLNDIAVTNSDFGTHANSTLSILTNQGDFLFSQRQYPTRQGPAFLSIGDVNGDNRLDIVVSETGAGTVSILLGQGHQYERRSWPVSEFIGANIIHDFDGDGLRDLGVVSGASITIMPHRCW
jgi:hypothetical protein